MAITTALALGLGAAALGAGGSVLSGNAQKKAVDKASDTAAATADKNNALARELYERNSANMSPFMDSGRRANSAFDELLYGPSAAPAPSAFAPAAAAAQPYAFASYGGPMIEEGGEPYGAAGRFPRMMPQGYSNMQYGVPVFAGPSPAGTVAAPSPAPSAKSAFDRYLESTGYQFRFDEGMKGLNIGAGAHGMLESGARDKAAIRYGQGIASDEFARYMQLLDNQQRLGFGGASALAGVGQNMVSSITANNNSASSAAANAALASGAANANMYSGIANAFGSALGSLGSSYQKKAFG